MTISLNENTRGYFKSIDSIRPNNVSFSSFLGEAAKEFYNNNKDSALKITDFTNNDIVPMPKYYSEAQIWRAYILNTMPETDIRKFQNRLMYLQNIVDKRTAGMLG